MARLYSTALVLGLSFGCHGYWDRECGGSPGEFLLPEQRALDCSLRSLGLEYAAAALANNPWRDMALPLVHHAFNLSVCSVPVPPASTSPPQSSFTREDVIASLGARAKAPVMEIFVALAGSDVRGDGTQAKPFGTVARAQLKARTAAAFGGAVVVWLRAGTHFQEQPLVLTNADSGLSVAVVYAGYPGESATLSGSRGALPKSLPWEPVGAVERSTLGLDAAGPTVYRTKLPQDWLTTKFVGLFADGVRLPRARYPNCDSITGTDCYLLNASGPSSGPNSHNVRISSIPGAYNLDVVNQHGVDMFADTSDNAQSTGPHGGADGTLPWNTSRKLVVQHADFAWRCHEDCGWGAFAHWQNTVCRNATEPPPSRSYGDPPTTACRHDMTYNEPFWDQQVSGGFFYNSTAKAVPWAPAWTNKQWATPSTGVVHMYHSARWGGWQFQLGARNDTDSTLQFMCTLIEQDPNSTVGLWKPVAGGPVPCPKQGEPHSADAVVHGGWQEARGGAIGAQYTAPDFNNSYFVENIKEELDCPGEWFLDLDEGNLYLIPPGAGPGAAAAHAHPGSLELVPVHSPRVVSLLGNGSDAPLRHITLANLTIAHAAITFLEPYEVPSGGDWAVHRGAAVFIDGASEVEIVGNHFSQVDGNGVFLSRFVRNASVLRNAFTDVGDTAILVVGASGRHRTNQVDNTDYPAFNRVAENYVGNVGVWAKQSAAYFKSITRANLLLNNVFHDGPRSGINFNDGAMGGEVMTGNLLLNYVKESNDHGPFNSWDRQPYVYSVDDDVLSISPQTHVISHNLIFNINFRGSSCGSIALDHDDESSQYDDNNNVLVFGGIKFFDGINRSASENLIIHPWAGRAAGPPCFHALQANRNLSSHFSHFTANTCVIRAGDYPYYCDAGGAPFFNKTDRVDVRDNIFYRINATEAQAQDWGGACGCWPGHVPCTIKNLSDWQAFGNDIGSVVKTTLADADLIAMARAKLNWA